MLQWIKNMFRSSQPAGPTQTIKRFSPPDRTITEDILTSDDESWSAETADTQTIRLFEIDDPQLENGLLTYRAELKSENVQKKSYLEMWCRLPGQGEFFSKGLHNALKGTNDWGSYEVPFHLKPGQKPDQIKLNMTVEGGGKLWIRNIELLFTPSN